MHHDHHHYTGNHCLIKGNYCEKLLDTSNIVRIKLCLENYYQRDLIQPSSY